MAACELQSKVLQMGDVGEYNMRVITGVIDGDTRYAALHSIHGFLHRTQQVVVAIRVCAAYMH